MSKNDHFRHMLQTASARGFAPTLVAFDSWYASLENLKLVRTLSWDWLTQLKRNRLVNPDGQGNRPVSDIYVRLHGRRVHLKGYGWVQVFKTVATLSRGRGHGENGDAEYWATSRLHTLVARDSVVMTLEQCAFYALDAWQIEVYHQGLKQTTGVERAQFRVASAQRNHIGLAIRAFLRLELHRLRTGTSCVEAKRVIIRDAVRAYLANPAYTLPATA